jgi:hypothetical protein
LNYSEWKVEWWQSQPNLVAVLEQIRNIVAKHKQIEIVMCLGERIDKVKEQIAKLGGGVTKDSLLVASAYCFILARANAAKGTNSLALLFTHRALDFYLQYQCVIKRLLIVGSGYVNSIPSQDMITLINSYNRLVMTEPLMGQQSRTRFINDLNGKRNKLIHTHSMYGLVADPMSDCVERAHQEIEAMDASNPTWKQVVRDLNPYLIVPETLLFDLEDSFDSYLTRVEFRELELVQ